MNSGIYKIVNKVTNKFYIGSSKNFTNRKNRHWVNLIKNKHDNIHLQRSWNKHGGDNFDFIIIEKCEIQNLITREQFFIDTLNPEYNICRIAGSSLGVKHTPNSPEIIEKRKIAIREALTPERIQAKIDIGKKLGLNNKGKPSNKKGTQLSSEIRLKMSISRKGVKKGSPSDIARRNMSLAQTGLTTHKKREHQKRMIEKLKKKVIGINLNSKEERLFESISDAARCLNLHRSEITRICNNQRNLKHTGGWKFSYLTTKEVGKNE